MAYSDLGVLNPSQTQQGSNYLDAARAEATKQAAYLSSMDQFYAELEASTTAQDKDIAHDVWKTEFMGDLEETRLGYEDEWRQETTDLGYADIASREKLGYASIESNERVSENQLEYQDRWESSRLDFEKDESTWIRDQYEDQNQPDYISSWSARTGLNPEWYNAAHNPWGFGG